MGRPKGSKNGFVATIKKTCEVCGASFDTMPYRVATSRFCSRKCQSINHSKELLKPTVHFCLQCGKQFITSPSSKKIFCSRQCSQKARNGQHFLSRAERITKTCPVCKKPFSFRELEHKTYCSKKCADASFKRRIDLVCQACGKTYSVRPKFNDQKFCSRTCRTVGIGKSETGIEKIMKSALLESGVDFVSQYPIFRYTLDFAIPTKKVAIECDGDYWHSLPGAKENDARKDTYLANHGWKVLRFSGAKINSEINACIEQIQSKIN